MSLRRRSAAAAFGICTLVAYVALPSEAAGAATVGSEIAVSDPVMQTQTRAFGQLNFDMVFDGTRWFVVWGEDRGGDVDVMGGRVGTDGSLPDGDGITISTGVNDTTKRAQNPSVAVDSDGQFLVAWTNGDPGDTDIYAARVSAGGRVVDPAAIPISVGTDVDASPTVAWNGEVFLVAFTRVGNPNQAHAALVSPQGTVQSLGQVDPNLTNVDAAALGSTFLLVGSRGIDNVAGRRIGGDGTFLGATFQISPATAPFSQSQPNVAAGSTQWVVAWTDERNADDVPDVFASRIGSSGTVLDPDGIPVATAEGPQELPRIAMKGDTALIAWRDRRSGSVEAFAAHLSTSGTVAEANGFLVAAGGNPGAVVAGPGSGYSIVYQRSAPEAPYGGATRGFVRTVSPK